MLQSQPIERSLELGALGPAEAPRRDLGPRLSFTVAYELWLGSWEAALAALATAIQSRTLSTNEAAAHKAVIAAERAIVTREFTLLIGEDLLENSRVVQTPRS